MLTMRLLFSSLLLIVLSPFLLAQSKIDLPTQAKGTLPVTSMPALTGDCGTTVGTVSLNCPSNAANQLVKLNNRGKLPSLLLPSFSTSGPYLRYDVYGTPISSCYYLYTPCYPGWLAASLGSPNLSDYNVTDAFAADIANIVFAYKNPSLGSSTLTTMETSTWEVYNASLSARVGAYETAVFNPTYQAAISWVGTPSQNKIPAFNITTPIPTTWTSSSIYPAPSTGWSPDTTYPAITGLQSTTLGSSIQWPTIYTQSNGVIYLWYRIIDSNTGTFTWSVDGSTPVTVYNYGHSSSGAIAISTATAGTYAPFQNSKGNVPWPGWGTQSVALLRISGLSFGPHVLTTTVSSSSGTVSILGIGFPPTVASTSAIYVLGTIPWCTNCGSPPEKITASSAYNTDILNDVTTLQNDGVNVTFVDIQKYMHGLTGEYISNDEHAYPNYTIGQPEILQAFSEAIHAAYTATPQYLNANPQTPTAALGVGLAPIVVPKNAGSWTYSYACIGITPATSPTYFSQYATGSATANALHYGNTISVQCPAVVNSLGVRVYRTASGSTLSTFLLLGVLPPDGGIIYDTTGDDFSCGSMSGCSVVSSIPVPNAPLANFHILTDSLVGTVTLTSGTSDNATVTEAQPTSHCWLQATNSLAAASNTVLAYPSSVSTNTVTITHAATVANGATFNVFCSMN